MRKQNVATNKINLLINFIMFPVFILLFCFPSYTGLLEHTIIPQRVQSPSSILHTPKRKQQPKKKKHQKLLTNDPKYL